MVIHYQPACFTLFVNPRFCLPNMFCSTLLSSTIFLSVVNLKWTNKILQLPHLQHVFGTWQTQHTADRDNHNKCYQTLLMFCVPERKYWTIYQNLGLLNYQMSMSVVLKILYLSGADKLELVLTLLSTVVCEITCPSLSD